MSVSTSTRISSSGPARAPRPVYRVTGRHVLRSEWAKLWSLRSTWITLGLGLLFLVAFGVIAAIRYKTSIVAGQQMDPDFASSTALSVSLFGIPIAQPLKQLRRALNIGEHQCDGPAWELGHPVSLRTRARPQGHSQPLRRGSLSRPGCGRQRRYARRVVFERPPGRVRIDHDRST